ncbi:hypothetical protein C3942_13870 [Solimonas fluminis]|uniref:FimV N-terminal domain-containing protein n=2 Tax=Solimonas fluminis TaxID=2086571 RepID=A0A2S5TED6_9GAMM|nr:hypothetical protein C3942_13870 [Solimonas fluminis]
MTGLGMSTGAQAVSLSDAQLRSRLGQRLDLRMELQHAKGEAPSISMAPAAEYARLGIDPPSRQMGELTVEREVIEEGREQIRVRSSSRVSEPILTLLLEVREGNTRLIREFTTFVDPPAATMPDAEPLPAAPPVSPLLSSLTLEPALPAAAPVRAAPAARRTPSPSAAPVDAPAASAAGKTPLPRFRLDERYAGSVGGAQVVIAAATTAWLRREFGGGAETAATEAPEVRSEPESESESIPALPPPEPSRAAAPVASGEPSKAHAPPPPWRSFLTLLAVTVGIFAYARRLRQRLMREAAAEISLEKAVA